MKKFNLNTAKLRSFTAAFMTSALVLQSTAFASSEGTFDEVVNPIVLLLQSLTGPALALVGAFGSLYCVILGVKFAKAEEPQDREKAKAHLKNAIIGFVLIFVLIVALHFGLKAMVNWVYLQTGIKYNVG